MKEKRIVMIISVLALIAAVNFLPMVTFKVPGMETYNFSGIDVHAMEKDAEEAQIIAARIKEQSGRRCTAKPSAWRDTFSPPGSSETIQRNMC